jgi:hypothetical protein
MFFPPIVTQSPPLMAQTVADVPPSPNPSGAAPQNTPVQPAEPFIAPVEITPEAVQNSKAADLGAPQEVTAPLSPETPEPEISIGFGLAPAAILVTPASNLPSSTINFSQIPSLTPAPPPPSPATPAPLAPAAPELNTPAQPTPAPPTEQPGSPTPPPPGSTDSPPTETVLEVSADSQEYDTIQRVMTAVGNVMLRYQGGELKADRIQSLAQQQRIIAEGNVQLTRGEQVLLGDRLEYDLKTKTGTFFKPSGTIFLPSASRDFSVQTPGTTSAGSNPLVPLNGSLSRANQTVQTKSGVQRLRFAADRIAFGESTWQAINVRITNDPFSPAELELRADQAQLTRLATREDVVTLQRPRLVFDQNIAIPIPRRRAVLNSQRQDPFGIDIGFDDRDRGGLYLGRRFTPFDSKAFTFSITPQFFIERAISDRNFDLTDPDLYGVSLALQSRIDSKTRLTGFGVLRSFDFPKIGDNLRAGLRIQRSFGDYQLALEAAYRERVLNGTLGERTIQNRIGGIFSSPVIPIGKSGLEISYRLSAEYITAETDRAIPFPLDSLARFQGAISLRYPWTLWKGKTLPATATEGMRYTPEPLQPSLRIVATGTGIGSGYSNGDAQGSLIGKIQLEGQFGHFSRSYLDYTGFFVGFSQGVQIGESPFLFDRVVDRQVLSFGILQQIYGPIRVGFQTSVNLDSGELFNTDIILDYSRRTYGLSFRYNPNLQVGSVVFRINSFNWLFNRDPLTSPEVGVVESGVQQTNEPF